MASGITVRTELHRADLCQNSPCGRNSLRAASCRKQWKVAGVKVLPLACVGEHFTAEVAWEREANVTDLEMCDLLPVANTLAIWVNCQLFLIKLCSC